MTTTVAEPQNWTTLQKIAFRFFFAFFMLYIFFQPNGVFPNTDNLIEFYLHPAVLFIPWVGKNLFHVHVIVNSYESGSGDRMFDFLVYFFVLVLSAITCIIWSITGKNTRNYNKLLYWLAVAVRYYAGITMLCYGGVKVIKLQFAAPSPLLLSEPVGNMGPFNLAWTYMGHSIAFNYFTGLAEISCGLLMFWRRTTTLGAVMGFVIAGNIVAINYCFAVPVKLLSTTLLFMFTFLLVKDSKRLINVFLSNKTALPADLSPHRFNIRWKNVTLTIIKYAVIVYVIIADTYAFTDADKQFGDNAKKPALYGIYNVQYFIRNKDTLPPLTTDTLRWQKLAIGKFNDAEIKLMNDSLKNYMSTTDTVKHILKVFSPADTVHKWALNYTLTKPGVLLLTGKFKKDSIQVRLNKFDIKKYKLVSTPFHWVIEN